MGRKLVDASDWPAKFDACTFDGEFVPLCGKTEEKHEDLDAAQELTSQNQQSAPSIAGQIEGDGSGKCEEYSHAEVPNAMQRVQRVVEAAKQQAITDVSDFVEDCVARHKNLDQKPERIDALYELAKRTLLDAKVLADELKAKERQLAGEYFQEAISKANAEAREIVKNAKQHELDLKERSIVRKADLRRCCLFRHNWSQVSLKRTCKRCGRIENFQQNIYGDAHWRRGSCGVGIQPVVGRVGGLTIAAALIFLFTFMLGLLNTEPLLYGASSFEFSGTQWTAKSNLYRIGPGPNYFSSDNVIVDDNGLLHLKVEEVDGRWSTAEVISEKSFGYGTYSFTLGHLRDRMSDGIVLGFFTWDDSTTQFHREIDIELRGAGIDGVESKGTFSVQPWDESGHMQPITVDLTSGDEYSFRWSPNSIEFLIRDAEDRIQQSWTATGISIPTPGNEKARINLWLAGGNPPADLLPVDIILESFVYQPLLPSASGFD